MTQFALDEIWKRKAIHDAWREADGQPTTRDDVEYLLRAVTKLSGSLATLIHMPYVYDPATAGSLSLDDTHPDEMAPIIALLKAVEKGTL